MLSNSLSISIHSLVRGRTVGTMASESKKRISIHSLVRGRTHSGIYKRIIEDISIHSLVRGRTVWLISVGREIDHFNPLPRKRENGYNILPQEVYVISIHSLVRGRTVPSRTPHYSAIISIHSLVRGRTWHILLHSYRYQEFQSTPS